MTFSSQAAQTILFLAANPKDTSRLRLDQELRDIDEGLRRSQQREQFAMEQRMAVRPRDMQRAMLDVNPSIVHFSGHGEGAAGLLFEDVSGNAKPVTGAALASLFGLFAEQIQCVVLNGCYSEVQAQAIVAHIPYVIGMNRAIGDKAAIAFSVGFYDALGAGRDIEFAYKLGCNAIQMEAGGQGVSRKAIVDEPLGAPAPSGEHLTPVLLKKSDLQSAANKVSGIDPAAPAANAPSPHVATSQRPSSPMPSSQPIEVFISFSHKDETLKDALCDQLAPLKRNGMIQPWQDWDIEPGTEWNEEIAAKLESAGIILLLVSPGFIASDYCFTQEMQRAMERHDAGTARVIPVILKPCDWQEMPFSKLQGLPMGGKPVNTWDNQDEALLSVAKGVRRAVESLRKH